MDFQKLIRARYSVRAYKNDPVPKESLAQVLEAARLAPTAANLQAFRIIVIETEGREQDLGRIYGKPWFTQPPIVLCVCAIPSQNWVRSDGVNYSYVDAAIVMDHIILAAADIGLGTCWIGAFDPAEARSVLGIPGDVEPVAFTPLGFPAGKPKDKKRKNIEDIVLYGRWE